MTNDAYRFQPWHLLAWPSFSFPVPPCKLSSLMRGTWLGQDGAGKASTIYIYICIYTCIYIYEYISSIYGTNHLNIDAHTAITVYVYSILQ